MYGRNHTAIIIQLKIKRKYIQGCTCICIEKLWMYVQETATVLEWLEVSGGDDISLCVLL